MGVEEQFVPYKQALKLKELGLNEECLACYTENAIGSTKEQKLQYFIQPQEKINEDFVFVSAPLYSQAFDWFRKKGYVIQLDLPDCINFEGHDDLVYYFKISDYDGWRGGLRNTYKSDSYDSLEEARQACLEKLIEILEYENNKTNN